MADNPSMPQSPSHLDRRSHLNAGRQFPRRENRADPAAQHWKTVAGLDEMESWLPASLSSVRNDAAAEPPTIPDLFLLLQIREASSRPRSISRDG
jgi:hypothetical protein